MIVYGIDPSLTATGIAVVDTDDLLVVETSTITSKGSVVATLTQRRKRLAELVREATRGPVAVDDARVVLEAPAYSRNNAGTWDRAGLWWLIVDELFLHRVPVITIAPTSRAKYATGKGTAGKDEVLLAVAKRFAHVDVANNNEADALVLAAMGADLAGHPIVEMPAAHRASLDKVTVPRGWAA